MSYNFNNVNITVKNNLCIGCGLCKVSCDYDAIHMVFNKNKEYNPLINDNCTYCGVCYDICPMSEHNLNSRIKDSASIGPSYGLQSQNAIFKGYEINYDNYIKSASGGILSALVKFLLNQGIIDAVVHAEHVPGNENSKYFMASISKSPEEIDAKRSSFYYPIEFSDVLEQIKHDKNYNKVAVLGVPCVLSGLKYLRSVDHSIDQKIKYTFALTCSHNTSAQFTDRLIDSFKPDRNKKYTFKHRDKIQIPNAANFNNSIKSDDQQEIRKSRNKTPFTFNWRTYSYSLNGCMYCPDFWGIDADAGFKDAWGFDLERKEGETVFYINKPELEDIIYQMQETGVVSISNVTIDQLIKSQKDTVVHKTTYIEYNQQRNKALRQLIKNRQLKNITLIERLLLYIDYNIKKRHIRRSKFLYRNFKFPIPNFLLKFPAFLLRKISVYLSILSLIKEQEHPFEVLYTAGFGYKNIGDEAQLSSNLSIWKETAPNAKLVLLSPNPDYTRKTHGNYEIIKAARNTFWGFKGIEYAGIGNRKLFKYYFKLKFIGLRVNAFFIKYFNTSFCISPESSYLLKKLKTAKVLHIGGGGYLTGKTFSRLYDNMGLIHLANYFNTDIILSGHNIGIWQNKSQKRIAKKLKKAKLIGLRDNDNSIKDLKEIGVYSEKKVFAFFDDALFCESVSNEKLKSSFGQNNISIDQKYILVNSYYFKNTEKIVKETLVELAKLLNQASAEYNYNIILLSMHSSDNTALQFLQTQLKCETPIFNHQDDFKIAISLIQNAELTITMRHHPIIFSMAGCVPTLSIVFDDYFKHKNIGAMKLFGQEDLVLMYDDLFNDVFAKQLRNVLEHKDQIKTRIKKHLDEYRLKKGFIIKKYLENYAHHMLKTNAK